MSLQSDSELILELISILTRNGFRKIAPFISGGKLDDATNKQGWTPPPHNQATAMRAWKLVGHRQMHNPSCRTGLAGRVKWAIYLQLKMGSQMRLWCHNYTPQVCSTGSRVRSKLWHGGGRVASIEVLMCRLWTGSVLRPLTRLVSLEKPCKIFCRCWLERQWGKE